MKNLILIFFLFFIGCNSSKTIIVEEKLWIRTMELQYLGKETITYSQNDAQSIDSKIIKYWTESDYVFDYDLEGNYSGHFEIETCWLIRPWITSEIFTATGNENPEWPEVPLCNGIEQRYKPTEKLYIKSGNLTLECQKFMWNKLSKGDAIIATYRDNKLKDFKLVDSEVEEYDW